MKLPFVSRKKYDKLMDDYEEAIYKLECLLCHATGNKFSKHTYDLRVMEMAVDDYIDDLCNETAQDVQDVRHLTPCDMCKYNPPSSGDEKPCCLCPASAKIEEE